MMRFGRLPASTLLLVNAVLGVGAPAVVYAAPPTQRWVTVLDAPWFTAARGTLTLRTARPGVQDELTVQVVRRGDRVRLQVVSPGKFRGASLMACGGRLWHLDLHGRWVVLPKEAWHRGWLDTYFTPADLFGVEHLHRDYDALATFTGSYDGSEVTEVTFIARARDAAWGKVVARLRTADGVPQQIRYYDHEGMLVRRQLLMGVRSDAERTQTMLRRIVDADSASGSYSELLVRTP